jgi:hypothetical protein
MSTLAGRSTKIDIRGTRVALRRLRKLRGTVVRWSTVDDRRLEEAVVQARMGLLFVGLKT